MAVEIRVRTRISDEELEEKKGKILTPSDFNVLLTGPAKVLKPSGGLLCVYLPGVLKSFSQDEAVYGVLHSLRSMRTDNRGLASGSERVRRGTEKRTRSALVASTILGSFDPGGPKQFCRLTAWTGQQLDKYELIHPMLREMDKHLSANVPDRYQNQLAEVKKTDPSWVIPGTVFSTVTVNNTYPTGVHTDKGDLERGFSTLAVIRRGKYTGGIFTFPRYRVGVNMQDGDLMLLDAHEWHGNTKLNLQSDDAERISVVAYYRENMITCGTPEEEYQKAVAYAEKRSK